jgi:peptide/nickel transport system permease protein
VTRRAILVTALVLFSAVFFLLVDGRMQTYANVIDQAHWRGDPLPPCFVNAGNCGGHILGSDENGRDLLSRLWVGGVLSLTLSFLAVTLELLIGFALGALARSGGKAISFVVLRVADGVSCFPPWLLLVAILMFATPAHRATLSAAIIAAIAAILLSPRITRQVALAGSFRGAARAALNQAAQDWPKALVLLATIDYFGFGIQHPTASWGNMLEYAQMNMMAGWWIVAFPGLCIFIAAFTIEILRRGFLAANPNLASAVEPV